MNYFELYEMPMHCNIDKAALKRKYYLLSKKYHPDFFETNELITEEENLAIAAKVNEGYTLLQHTNNTLGYILLQKNVLQKEEKYQLPPVFLIEVMELNEDMNENSSKAIDELMKQIEQPVAQLILAPNMELLNQNELLLLKEYYYKWKYLDRLQQRTNGIETFD